MPVSAEYRAYVEELFEAMGPVTVRSMFGGAGIFAGEVMFGLIARDTIFLKVDDENRGDYEAEGLKPFAYGRDGSRTMSYFEMPERLYDDPEELVQWARKAVDAALKSNAKKPGKSKRKGRQ